MRTGLGAEREARHLPEGWVRALDEFSQLLRSVESEQRLYEVAARRVTTALRLEGATILLYDALSDRLRAAARAGRSRSVDEAVARAFVRFERPEVPRDRVMALLRRRNKTVGLVIADRPQGEPWPEAERQLLLQLSARISDELPRLRERQLTEAQLRIATQLLEDRRPNDVFYHILDALHHLTRYDHSGGLLIFDPESHALQLRAEKITWEKGKSRQVGLRVALDPEISRELQEGRASTARRGPGETWRAETPVLARLAGHLAFYTEPSEAALLWMPLLFRNRLLGLLKLASRRPGAFDAEDMSAVARLNEPASAAIQALLERVDEQERLGALLSVGNRLAANQDSSQILQEIAHQLTRTMGYQACCFRQLDNDGNLVTRSCAGFPPRPPAEESLRAGEEGLLTRVVQTGEAARVFNLSNAPDYEFPEYAEAGLVRSLLAIPIELDGQVVGVLDCYTHVPHTFAEEEVRVISLFASQVALAVRNARAIEELQRLNTELLEATQRITSIGREIQTSLLPGDRFDLGTFRLLARSEPAQEVGGDLYNVFPISARKHAVVLGDVSGKGIQGAMYMTVATTLLEARAEHGVTPAAALADANRRLYPKIRRARMFVSLLYGALDLQERTLTFSNAGQCPPIYLPLGGEPQLVRIPGLPLGALQDAQYQQGILRLQPGDLLVIYSDGFIEARTEDGQPLGYDGLQQLVAEAPTRDGEELLNYMFETTLAYATEDRDDLTALVIESLEG
jgi:serine phosphatase RsbU (regulator of sigma subunit)/putative methionine-R-sulfoxide reductase with GAF domain